MKQVNYTESNILRAFLMKQVNYENISDMFTHFEFQTGRWYGPTGQLIKVAYSIESNHKALFDNTLFVDVYFYDSTRGLSGGFYFTRDSEIGQNGIKKELMKRYDSQNYSDYDFRAYKVLTDFFEWY